MYSIQYCCLLYLLTLFKVPFGFSFVNLTMVLTNSKYTWLDSSFSVGHFANMMGNDDAKNLVANEKGRGGNYLPEELACYLACPLIPNDKISQFTPQWGVPMKLIKCILSSLGM